MRTPNERTIPGTQISSNRAMHRPAHIRTYRPITDHSEVVDICRHVYGGNDALPYEINEQARDPSTRVFVCADAEEDRLQALMACQVRGQVLWLWGARTREERRGQGLAKQLMAQVWEHACQVPGLEAIISTTIVSNEGMRRVFDQHGFVIQARVDCWGRRRTPLERSLQTTRGNWRLCRTAGALIDALQKWRQRRILVHRGSASQSAFTWVPAFYAVWPAGSDHMQKEILKGRVWLLKDSLNEDCTHAVLHLARKGNSVTASIVAATLAGVEAAVHQACLVEPDCSQFYVDACDALPPEENPFLHLDGHYDFIVVHKYLK